MDFYKTPLPLTAAILSRLQLHNLAKFRVLDPSCGDGAMLDVCKERGARTFGIELNEGRALQSRELGHEVVIADALSIEWDPTADLCLQNPPFGQALAMVQKAAVWADRNKRRSISLVRSNFLSSKGRAAFHQAYPSDAYFLAGRPSFTGDGKTDASDYVFLVHGRGTSGRWEVLDWAPRVRGDAPAPPPEPRRKRMKQAPLLDTVVHTDAPQHEEATAAE
jgi:hypothetical protein